MRRHKKAQKEAELDITSFMNLMIVLVPVLLLNMVFAQTAVLDLKLPLGSSSGAPINPEEVSVEVTIRKTGMQVIVAAGGASRLIGDIPVKTGAHDFAKLSTVLKNVKYNFPDKRDLVLLPAKDVSYQVLVATMDAARSYETVVAASVVDAVLFPEVSLGEAAELAAAQEGPK